MKLKINTDRCEVNKRRLVLDFDYDDLNYRYEHDHWSDDVTTNIFTVDGAVGHPPTIMQTYKHTVTVALHSIGKEMETLFIDRAYRHNRSFDVYFRGEVYHVGDDTNNPLNN